MGLFGSARVNGNTGPTLQFIYDKVVKGIDIVCGVGDEECTFFELVDFFSFLISLFATSASDILFGKDTSTSAMPSLEIMTWLR